MYAEKSYIFLKPASKCEIKANQLTNCDTIY